MLKIVHVCECTCTNLIQRNETRGHGLIRFWFWFMRTVGDTEETQKGPDEAASLGGCPSPASNQSLTQSGPARMSSLGQ